MNRTWIIGLGCVAALAAGVVAQAQISAKGGPIDVTSDHLSADNTNNMATYQGHVEALQDGNRMRSDLLNVYFKPHADKGAASGKDSGPTSGMSKIDHMEAIGNVYFVTPTQVIRGDKAVWTQADDTIVVTGQVVMTQGQDVMRGTRLVYHHSTGQSTMDSDTGRVRSIFYQDKKSNPAG